MNLAAANDGYVFAAYGIAAAVTVALVLWTAWRYRHARLALERLEALLGERRPGTRA
jgi:heme exporter protein CcmD